MAPSGKLHLVVVSHDRTLLDRQCDQVGLPGRQGDLGILPGHAAFLGALRPGVMSAKTGPESVSAAISAGFCEVLDDRVTVLVDNADFAGDLDVEAVTAKLQAAQESVEHAESDQLGELQDQVALAEAQLTVLGN